MELEKDGYTFIFNSTQGIVNIEKDDDFVTCIELGAGTKLSNADFKELCNEWLRKRK